MENNYCIYESLVISMKVKNNKVLDWNIDTV